VWQSLSRLSEAPTWLRSRAMATVWLSACDSVGPKTRTFFRPHIQNAGRIVIGGGVRLNSNWAPLELVTGPNGVIEIGDGVYVNYGTLISAERHVRIGANVMIGNYCLISDTEIPAIAAPRPPALGSPRPVEIGDGAWLAARVTVLPGSRIGARAVIAAGSVVAGVIPAGAVAGGIPARILRRDAAAAPADGASERLVPEGTEE
jgi:acetyltransferase-like isoleucine patch superfamily enzyme